MYGSGMTPNQSIHTSIDQDRLKQQDEDGYQLRAQMLFKGKNLAHVMNRHDVSSSFDDHFTMNTVVKPEFVSSSR